jgi:hypothetical protein
MIETHLEALRRDPPPEFAARLRTQLDATDRADRASSRWHPGRLLAPAAAVALVGALLTVPGVRAAAASFLARFRVVNFVAVPVDPGRVSALGGQQVELGRLIGEHVEVLRDASPVPVGTLAEASAQAGFDVRVPAWLPADSRIIETAVTGPRAIRVTGDSARLKDLLDALGIDDVTVPEGLDGQTATLEVAPVVMIRWEHGQRRSRLLQSLPPELTMPAGIDVAALGEIGLRILGLSAHDARQFAGSIDWANTLVVPIPPTATSFRQVDVSGRQGLWIAYQPPNESPTNLVLWASDDRVYGLLSLQGIDQVLAMANSIP